MDAFNRMGGWSKSIVSTADILSLQIERACEISLSEPNTQLNMEIASLIKTKKANTAREAAVTVLKQINSRNPHVSLLGLKLLETLVEQCGYPFHLQIGTKDFLNELVRRFPEHPPQHPSSIMSRILKMIDEWKNTLCVTSKYKEDLVHIRDMWKLLTYKGYRFPDRRSAKAVEAELASATSNLKTPAELEEEDREAQSAKLQELIRRGKPRDLEKANELMKVLTGAEPQNIDYSKQTEKELDKVQSKALLLNDLLDNYSQKEKFTRGDAYDQIATICYHARPKLQKLIENENDDGRDHAYLERLLHINDLTNAVLNRYEAMKKGLSAPTITFNSASSAKTNLPQSSSSLIDFSAEEDELLNSGQGIALNTTSNSGLPSDLLSLMDEPSTSNISGKSLGNSGTEDFANLPLDIFSQSANSTSTAEKNRKDLTLTLKQHYASSNDHQLRPAATQLPSQSWTPILPQNSLAQTSAPAKSVDSPANSTTKKVDDAFADLLL